MHAAPESWSKYTTLSSVKTRYAEPLGVVYFDQRLSAVHFKRWSKYNFSLFLLIWWDYKKWSDFKGSLGSTIFSRYWLSLFWRQTFFFVFTKTFSLSFVRADGAQGWWKSSAHPVLFLFGKVSHILHLGEDMFTYPLVVILLYKLFHVIIDQIISRYIPANGVHSAEHCLLVQIQPILLWSWFNNFEVIQ